MLSFKGLEEENEIRTTALVVLDRLSCVFLLQHSSSISGKALSVFVLYYHLVLAASSPIRTELLDGSSSCLVACFEFLFILSYLSYLADDADYR